MKTASKQDVGSITPIFLPEPAAPANAAGAGRRGSSRGCQAPRAAGDTPAVAQEEAIAKAPQMIALVFDRLTVRFAHAGLPCRDEVPRHSETSNNYLAVYSSTSS